MQWVAWFDVKFIQTIWKHTLNSALAMLSWMFLFWLGRKGIHGKVIRAILENTENILLVVMILIFALNVLHDLLPPPLRLVIYNVLPERFRNVFPSNLVIA